MEKLVLSISFLGCFTHSIDSQRRVAIPREWRLKKVGDDPVFYLMPGRDKSIQILPQNLFETGIMQTISRVPVTNAGKMRAIAQIGAKTSKSQCDKQGRITLTPYLMEYSGLQDQAVLIGGFSSIQVMSPESWEQAEMDNEDMLDQIEKIQESREL